VPPPPSNGAHDQEPGDDAPGDGEGELLALEAVKGIGASYAARLREAGIQSIGDLADATPADLDAIIKAPKWRQPDYASWIRYARMLTRGKR
jgi:polyhydroxyalkanoate synthase subunit PhaC